MRIIVFFIVFLYHGLFGQNLVPNASFELANDTITGHTLSNTDFNINIDSWKSLSSATPDIIGSKFSVWRLDLPAPRTGNTMAGIQSFYRTVWTTTEPYCEYIGVKLNEALIPNKTYYVEFWIRRSGFTSPKMNKDDFLNSNYGILFSIRERYKEHDKSSFTAGVRAAPQVSTDAKVLITDQEWTKVSQYFTPDEAYEFLYIGQFLSEEVRPVLMKGYYLIEDVLVQPVADFTTLDKGADLPVGSIIPLNNVNFLSGTTTLSDNSSYELLEDLANYLREKPTIKIRINGHTDAEGSEKSNLILSKKRAKSISTILTQKGISEDRIDWKGFGELVPIADNTTASGRLQNRRVEFEVIN